MMSPKKSFGIALIVTVLMAMLGGCDRPEGPAEQAGKKFDQATQKAGDKIEEAGDDIRDAVRDGQR